MSKVSLELISLGGSLKSLKSLASPELPSFGQNFRQRRSKLVFGGQAALQDGTRI